MKTVKQHLTIMSILLLVATSCTLSLTKSGYIRNFENWINDLKTEYRGYNESDWTKTEGEFTRFSETEYNRFKNDLTEEERKKIDNLKGQYYGILAKHKAGEVQQELKSIMDQAKGFIDELFEE